MNFNIENYYNRLFERLFQILNTKYGQAVFNSQCEFSIKKCYYNRNIKKFLNKMRGKYSDYLIIKNLVLMIIELNRRAEIKQQKLYNLTRKQIYDSKNKYKILRNKFYGVNKNRIVRPYKINNLKDKEKFKRTKIVPINKISEKVVIGPKRIKRLRRRIARQKNTLENKVKVLRDEKFFYI